MSKLQDKSSGLSSVLFLFVFLVAASGVAALTPDTIYVRATSSAAVPDTLECNHLYIISIDNPSAYYASGYSVNRTRFLRLVSRSGGAIHIEGNYDLRIGSQNDRLSIAATNGFAPAAVCQQAGYIDTVMASGTAALRMSSYSANSSSTHHSGFLLRAWVCCMDNEITGLAVSSVGSNSAQVSWSDNSGTATRWVVRYGSVRDIQTDSVVTTTPSAVLAGLYDNTTYYVSVYNNANTIDRFSHCRPNLVSFTTLPTTDLPTGCVDFLAIHSSAVTARYGLYSTPDVNTGVLDYGSASIASRHTVHADTAERDVRTGGVLRTVPADARASVRLGNWNSRNQAEQLVYTMVVDTTVSDMLLLRYAAVLQNPSHSAAVQPRFTYSITRPDGTPIGAEGCYDVEFVANTALGWNSYPAENVLWKDWTSVGMSLAGMHGDTVLITLTTKDCNENAGTHTGSHYGYVYFTLTCGTMNISFDGCHASAGDVVSAPDGFTYAWYERGNPSLILGTGRDFSIPAQGSYACDMQFVGSSGSTCTFTLNASATAQYPVADFVYNTVSVANDTFTVAFADSSSLYSGGTPVSSLTGATRRWVFPDGTVSTDASPTHVFDQPGNYAVTLIVDLAGECTDTIVKTVTLKSQTVRPDNIDSVDCAFTPSPTDWSIRLDAVLGSGPSGDSICTLINPLVGDLDGDGIPEIVCFSTRNYNNTAFSGGGNPGSRVKNVVVYDGRTFARKAKFDLPSYVSAFEATPFGLAKPYGGDALMVFACTDCNLYAYKLDGNGGATRVWGPVSYGSGNDYATTVGFADFNNDSIPEVYVRNKIFNLATGQLLLTVNSSNSGSTYAHVGNYSAGGRKPLSASFASDVAGDARCELLLGNEIHSINITNTGGTAGNSSTLYATAPSTGVSGIGSDGHVQVADFNLDGHPDLFISSRPAQGNSGTVYGYVWDVHNNTVSTPIVQAVSLPGKSIPLIADIDNDNVPEVVLHCGVSGANIRAYKYDAATRTFSLFWTKGFSEDSYSNSMTLFDFNQDGENELLICDNDMISIVNGSTPALAQNAISTLAFREVTIMQYPIIADIDNDGAAEIVFVGKQNSQSYQGTLNICRSNGDPWAPARPVWNQYMYNITNVNKDLTIPPVLFNNATAFVDPDSGVVRRPYNNFLQQATSLDNYGRPYYTAADLQPVGGTVELTEAGAHVTFDICNVGLSIFSSDTLRVQIYSGQYGASPVAGILFFGDASLPLQILPDSCLAVDVTIPYSRLCPHMPFDSLVFAVNDAGQGVAVGGLPAECNVLNNLLSLPNDILIQHDTVYDSICRGAVYDRGGFVVPADTTAILGVHYIRDTVSDPVHCQTIRLLVLTVLGNFVSDTVADVCDSLIWRGAVLTVSGDYSDTAQTAMGCDSIVNLHLTVHPSWSVDTSATACDRFVWYDTVFTASDTLTRRFATVAGCDSNVTLYLTVYPGFAADTVDAACETYTWSDGQTFIQSGDYTLSYTTSDGCDSVWTLHLSVYHDTLVDSLYTGCDTVLVRGVPFTGDTLVVDSLTSIHGCDSVIRLQIRVYPSYNDTVVDSMPAGAVYQFGGHEYTDSGLYTAAFVTAQGCDSVIWLRLSVYDLCELFLQFPNLVTPNGDGVNDRFVIKNLIEEGCYPINRLTIYNRWGARVFEAVNISKDSDFWDPAADRAPAGTYFYIFRGKGHKGRVERRGVIELIH